MKRSARFLISLLLQGMDVLRHAWRRWLGRQAPGTCVVLYYHGVPARHRQLLARQLDLLLDLARPLSTNPTQPIEAGRHHAVVTFDDGFFSVLQNARPELDKRQIPWTVFVPSGCLGQSPDWLRHAPGSARQDRVMTAAELRELARDPQLLGFDPALAEQLVKPANGVRPSPGPGEAIEDGLVEFGESDDDHHHDGN